jgi:hypothetical protein
VGENVVSRAKKAELNLKPPALPQLTPGLGKTCKNIFSLYKQIWYVPFFWTLTWYTYWILRAILFLNTPLTQVNPVNYTGAAISTTMLLIATPRLGTTIRKKSFFAATRVGINIKKMLFHAHFLSKNGSSTSFSKVKREVQDIQGETSKVQRPRIEYQASIGKSAGEKLEQHPQELMPPQSGASALPGKVCYSNQQRVSQEISAECLTCANLISCKYRRCESLETQARGSESSRCPFAMRLSINKAVAS